VNGILDLIGNTKLLDVSNLSPAENIKLYAKLENMNPFGSIKDRAAWAMIEDAYRSGRLVKGQRIVEPSSGNTGIALAGIAGKMGNPITVLLPENVSIERRQTLLAFGAHIITTPGSEGSNGAILRARKLAEENPEWCLLYQYANEANPRAHYSTTGPEIWRDCPQVSHFVAGLGTSGTLMGVGRYLKERNPEIVIVAVEPPIGENVDGLRNLDEGYIPPIFEAWGGERILGRKRIVRPRESIEKTRLLLRECGIFAGISSGASLAGALKIAEEHAETGKPAHIVFVVCDGGWKYLSTGAYDMELDEATATAERVIYF